MDKRYRITVVDRSTKHSFAPSYLWVMLGWRELGKIEKELSLLSKKELPILLDHYFRERGIRESQAMAPG